MDWTHELRRLLGRMRGGEGVAMQRSPGGISCQEAAERVFEWMDGALDPEETARVGTHLRTCAHCYPMLRFEEAFRAAVKDAASRPGAAPAGLEDRITEALTGSGGPAEES